MVAGAGWVVDGWWMVDGGGAHIMRATSFQREVPMRLLATLTPVVALLALGIAQETRSQTSPDRGTWTEKAKLGEQRTEAGVVAVNGKIYVMGGMARGADSSTLTQEYDPATDRWRERAPMPRPLSHPGAALLNGKIYVVGGFLKNVHLEAQD